MRRESAGVCRPWRRRPHRIDARAAVGGARSSRADAASAANGVPPVGVRRRWLRGSRLSPRKFRASSTNRNRAVSPGFEPAPAGGRGVQYYDPEHQPAISRRQRGRLSRGPSIRPGVRRSPCGKNATVAADANTNSIIVIAPPAVQQMYAELIDRPRPAAAAGADRVHDRHARYVQRRHASASTSARWAGSTTASSSTLSSFGVSTADPVTGRLTPVAAGRHLCAAQPEDRRRRHPRPGDQLAGAGWSPRRSCWSTTTARASSRAWRRSRSRSFSIAAARSR